MKKTRRSESRLWSVLLFVHLVLYVCCCLLALHYLSTLNAAGYSFHSYTLRIFAAMAWTPFVLLHVGIHYYVAGRRGVDEREIYREGYADAMRQLADRSYDTHYLTLDDEGELDEMPVSFSVGKRKRDRL